MTPVDTVTYYLRGPIERPKRGKGGEFVWKDGYSPDSVEGHVTYPWITKQEAQVQEKANGRKVVFGSEFRRRNKP